MKLIARFTNQFASPVITDFVQESSKISFIRDLVRNDRSRDLLDPVSLSTIEIVINIAKAESGDTLYLHLYGSKGEYILTPYKMNNIKTYFSFTGLEADDLDDEDDIKIAKIGFSSENDKIWYYCEARELELSDKEKFFATSTNLF